MLGCQPLVRPAVVKEIHSFDQPARFARGLQRRPRLYGGPDPDTVDGYNGRYRLFDNDGIDTGYNDGVKDFVDCGPGNEYVLAAGNGTVVDRESVY
jgi:hypothetical protein